MITDRILAPAARAGSLFLAVACLAGCHGAPRHFELQGQVVSKDVPNSQLTVNHGEIPGFMNAMAMPYNVKDPQGFAAVTPGDRISAEVVTAGPNDYWLEHVAITDSSGRGKPFAGAAASEPQPGDPVPDVTLVNQDGKTISLRQFKGQAVLISFIYTRCPLPNFCPLLSSEFASLHRQLLTDSTYPRTHLVSISLDPEFDQPPVLRKYGLQYLGGKPDGFSHWDFATASPADLQKLAAAFGVQYSGKGDQIAHSMQTVLISPQGTVIRNWPGNDWRPQEVLTAFEQAAGKPETAGP